MRQPPEILDFEKLVTSFTWDSYKSSVPDQLSEAEYETVTDPAARDAFAEEARTIISLPGLKRKFWNDAQTAASVYITEGYDITRFLLGTYRKPVSYAHSKSERKSACQKIISKSRSYEESHVVNAVSLSDELHEVFAGMAWATKSYLNQLLGPEKGHNMNLAMLFCGVRIALAEEYLFDLRRKYTASRVDTT